MTTTKTTAITTVPFGTTGIHILVRTPVIFVVIVCVWFVIATMATKAITVLHGNEVGMMTIAAGTMAIAVTRIITKTMLSIGITTDRPTLIPNPTKVLITTLTTTTTAIIGFNGS